MSDAILLWWGRDFYLSCDGNLSHRAMAERGDAGQTVLAMLAGVTSKPKGLRLIYQPIDLECRAEHCPNGSRALLRKTLSGDFKALSSPDLSWAALTPKPISEGSYSTIIFCEATSRLTRLIHVLEAKGITLTGAWPLARLVEAHAAIPNPDATGIGVVYIDTHVLIYSCNPLGEREVNLHDGVEAREIAVTDLRRAFSQFDESRAPVLLVGHGDAWDLAEAMGDSPVTSASLPDLLRSAESLRTDELASFIAPESFLTPSLLVKVAAVLMLLAAAWIGWKAVDARLVASSESKRMSLVRKDMRDSVAHLETNRQHADLTKAYLAECYLDTLGRGQFLEAVSRSCPPSVTLTMIRLSEQGFVVSGTCSEGVGQKAGPFFTLVDALTNPASKLWTIPPEGRPSVLANAEFTVSGRFLRQAPILKSANR